MKDRMKPLFNCSKAVLAFLLLSFLSLPVLRAQDVASAAIDPSGNWKCNWSSTSGYLFTGDVTLVAKEDGELTGQIVWTMKRSSREEEKAKLGMIGTEYIRGSYNFKTRIIELEGYKKDDPNNVIGLDHYRVLFAPNGACLGGLTENHGNWAAAFFASRK